MLIAGNFSNDDDYERAVILIQNLQPFMLIILLGDEELQTNAFTKSQVTKSPNKQRKNYALRCENVGRNVA
jgi:hypothetical protein